MRELLSDAVEAYARNRKSQGYAKNTLKVDGQVLKKFLAVNGNIWCHTISERHVERHFEEAARTRGSASLQNDHTVLNTFFKWARHTRRMPVDSDPMFGRRQPKATKRERNRVPVSDFPELLRVAEERDPRDRALCALMIYTLGRDSDVTNLRVRDLDLKGNWLTMRIEKTKQEDTMPVSEELSEEMHRWLSYYTAQVGNLEPNFYLVPPRSVHPIRDEVTGRIVRHNSTYKPDKRIKHSGPIVRPVLERMGFPTTDHNGRPLGEGAHTLRRSAARALFDELSKNGGYDHPLRIVQSMLHHASVTQTETYVGISADRRTRDEVIRGRRLFNVKADSTVIQLVK